MNAAIEPNTPRSCLSRWLRLLYVLIASVLFALPFLASLYFGADPLTVANESVAYRFLYSERLLGGEGSTVWVAAGFLTTAVQNVLLAVIDTFSGIAADDLRGRVHLFANATGALHSLLAAGIFFLAAQNRRLLWIDRLLLALVGLGPLYLTRTSGFYYYSLPDYYLTNVVLTLTAVFLFQNEWRREEEGNPLLRYTLLGCFVGLMVANKITMAPFAAVVLAPALLADSARDRAHVVRNLVAAGSAAAAYIFVLLAFYVFNVTAVFSMFKSWFRFSLNPGGEFDFWSADFVAHFTQYSFSYIFSFWVLTLLIVIVLERKREPLPCVFWLC